MAQLIRVRTLITFSPGGPGLMTHYFRGAAAVPVIADATDVVARVRAFLQANVLLLSASATWAPNGACDVIDDVTGDVVGSVVGVTPAVVVGTGASGDAPRSIQFIHRMITSTFIRGRRLRGRSNLGPVGGGTGQRVAPAAADITSIRNAAAANLGVGTTASFPVVWQRPNTLLGLTGQSAAITAHDVSPVWGSLRSRRD
jgi:hypothetical protein